MARPVLRGSVLIVDDEETVGEFMRELLESWGMQPTFVARGDAALDLVTAAPRRFDVVITDHAMPRITGLELGRRLHAIRADLPVILYTGYGEGLPVTSTEKGAPRTVLQKPIDPRRLREALEECLPGTA
jgi:CheY-like chemotaxis protein